MVYGEDLRVEKWFEFIIFSWTWFSKDFIDCQYEKIKFQRILFRQKGKEIIRVLQNILSLRKLFLNRFSKNAQSTRPLYHEWFTTTNWNICYKHKHDPPKDTIVKTPLRFFELICKIPS